MAPESNSRSGMSTIEMAIVTILLATLLGSIALAMERAVATFERSSANGDINARAARAIHRISQEMLGAREATLAPAPVLPFGSNSLEFEVPQTTAAGTVVWSPRRQIALQLGTGELDNGIDDDGDGLVDERSVVRVDDPGLPGERRVVLVNGVAELLQGELPNAVDDNGNGLIDEAGLSFSDENGALVIRLTLERIGPDNDLMQRTQSVSVVLRNGD